MAGHDHVARRERPTGARHRHRMQQDGSQPHRMWVLAVLALAQLMIVLDTTVVTIALPSAQTELGFTTGDRQWIITAYALSFGSLLLFCGRLTDLLGRKNTLMIGLFGFAAASAVGGAANGFAMLVVARAVQGCFAALLAPSVLSLLTTTFTAAKERGRAFGVFGAVVGSGAAVGLLLGGFLTEYLSWRWCLYVNIVFAVLALLGAFVLVRRRPSSATSRLDVPGVLTVSAGLFALVYGFSNAVQNGESNWDDPYTIGFLIAAVVLLSAFVVIQTRVKHPLLPPGVIAHRYRGPAFAALLLAGAGLFGALLFVTYYVQQTLGYSAVRTGVAFLPMVGCLMFASVGSNIVLIRRISPRILMPTGLTVAAVGLALLTRIDLHSSYAGVLLPSLILIGLGLGMAFSTSINLATLDVTENQAGPASASVNTAQQVGAAVGTALLNTLAIQAATAYVNANKAAVATSAASAKAAATLAAHAAIASYVAAFWWGAGLFAAGALVTVLLLRSPVPPALRHVAHEKEASAQDGLSDDQESASGTTPAVHAP